MNRFEQLTAKHLDGVATRDETDELSGLLERNAGAFSEFLSQFEMQELLAALHTPTDEARVDAVLNQLRHEADPFVESVARELRSARFGEPTSSWPERLLAWAAPRRITLAVCGAAGVTLVACLWGWFLGPVTGEPVLAEVKGTDVFVERATGFMVASNGMRMVSKDVLRIGTNSSAALAFGNERTTINFTSATDFTLTSFASGKRFNLRAGTFRATVSRQRPFHPMIITTPNAEARVLGTEFTLTARTNYTRLDVTEGKVRLADMGNPSNKPVKVFAGHSAVVAPATKLATLPKTGAISREWWNGVSWIAPSDSLDDPRFPGRPDGGGLFDRFEFEPMTTNRFGLRLYGYVHPPITGDYEFWLAGHADAQLFLSPSERVKEKVLIATVYSTGGPRDWDAPDRGSSRRSGAIHLQAGKRYYIEAIVTVPDGEGHLSVAWRRPGAPRELLTGEFLSPAVTKK